MKKKNIGEIIRESTNRHAKYRCLQRYGFELNSQKRYEAIRQIQSNRAKFVES
jgi:tRNA(Leu) C34 or U34 (ribose-2'-O)-methylase TrmL